MCPLTLYEREKIELYLQMGKKKTWIAGKLNRDYSVIKREIKRNSGEYLPYKASDAQHFALRRARSTNKRKLDKLKNKKLKEFVIGKLEKQWSPEQIAGRLDKKLPPGIKETVCIESVYDYIYNGAERQLHSNLKAPFLEKQPLFSLTGQKIKNFCQKIKPSNYPFVKPNFT